ncbi:leucine-rich repeat receptor-like protein kinase IMK2 [Hibiscus syriacus]|uniref:Leucine-rich repeat receptor-like protein kinase IMK2 n=1 Tax=Hibiscus syriacus TaxID=106335 RepID=A0A6A3BFH4_HIBSY|nr:probable leucine-rich repeat receptor-like protein kinase IMK3 [Hibiscus syriacus]KAE8714845.1 leucine-rich repeat receptor-like protein kinase IMK2 [Hibiscus syriacus]
MAIQEQKDRPKGISLLTHILFILHLLIVCFFIEPVSSDQGWDGVVVIAADFQALQAFKQELIDSKGFLKSWNDSGYGACSGGWVGIKCAKGQVIVIQLPWKGFGGRITEKIGQLQALRKLSLHDNLIQGSIPRALGILPDLRGVQLFNNRLSGSIPATLGSSLFLQTLDLSNNSLTGVIPESLANSTKLYRLNLSFNSFSGSVPISFTRSSSLIFLDLQYNNLSGPIPDSWGHQKLSRLRNLDLSYNAINGSLPVSLSNLSSLVVLNLESNGLEDQIPESIVNLHNLSVLVLKRNKLRGPIPASVGNISSLTKLDLSENKFIGEIPFSLANLKGLNSFNVSYNNLSGPVPAPLSQKFNGSSFVGNIELCGYSRSPPCPSPAPLQNLPSSPSAKPRHKNKKLSTKDIILIAAGALLIILLVLCLILLCCLIRRRDASKEKDGRTTTRAASASAAAARVEKGTPPSAGEVEAGGETGGKLVHFDGPMVFAADDLLCATAEIMGKSTYGTVYKATLEDGNQVAVKRLREKITKGQKEFESEVNLLGRVRHPNLLALRAYYLGPKGEKLLVFDYMPKGSLATFLHARGPETPVDWLTRMRIAKGVTRGLVYLHTQENIIHGNLTSSNVLLDEDTNAKIADFGLSRLMTAAANANVIATAGALGYRAPELSKLKKANTKTDAYSLGVIILELLTGKSPGEAMNGVDLPQWVASIVKEEWTNEVFDLELMRDASSIGDELLNTLKLGLHCVDPSPSARPEFQQVLQQLEEIRPDTPASSVPSGDDGAGVPSTSE